jgi:hypothetical protein
MSRGQAISCAVGLPMALLALIFLPAGSIAWPGRRRQSARSGR